MYNFVARIGIDIPQVYGTSPKIQPPANPVSGNKRRKNKVLTEVTKPS
jgi:hypothetical protein